jgi:hypothetical protein
MRTHPYHLARGPQGRRGEAQVPAGQRDRELEVVTHEQRLVQQHDALSVSGTSRV